MIFVIFLFPFYSNSEWFQIHGLQVKPRSSQLEMSKLALKKVTDPKPEEKFHPNPSLGKVSFTHYSLLLFGMFLNANFLHFSCIKKKLFNG